MREPELREDMCRLGARLWHRGLIGANEGNLSVRLDENRFLVTPAGLSKGHLRPDELVIVNREGAPAGPGAPSSEIRLHMGIYQQRSDCGAVVHAHPPIATGIAVAGSSIPDDLMPESAVVLGPVALVPFAMPGTDEVPDSLTPFIHRAKTFLLGHHGAVTLGRTLEDAYVRMETLERIAHVFLTAKLMGGPQRIVHPSYARLLAEHLHGRLD